MGPKIRGVKKKRKILSLHEIFFRVIVFGMMESQSCLYVISSLLDEFSSKERQIGEFILSNPSAAVYPTLQELADTIGVSESALFRFVKKIGYDGYRSFRIALATETVEPPRAVYDTEEDATDASSAIRTVFDTNIAALEHIRNTLDRESFERAVKSIITASRVYLFGLGGSGLIAQDAYHKFLRTGIRCSAPGDFHLQLMQASQLRPDETVLIVSHSGSNKDALALAEGVKERKATLIGMTSNSNAPLCRMADILLLSERCPPPCVREAFSTRITQLSIIDALYLSLMNHLGDEGRESITRMREAISRRRLRGDTSIA